MVKELCDIPTMNKPRETIYVRNFGNMIVDPLAQDRIYVLINAQAYGKRIVAMVKRTSCKPGIQKHLSLLRLRHHMTAPCLEQGVGWSLHFGHAGPPREQDGQTLHLDCDPEHHCHYQLTKNVTQVG